MDELVTIPQLIQEFQPPLRGISIGSVGKLERVVAEKIWGVRLRGASRDMKESVLHRHDLVRGGLDGACRTSPARCGRFGVELDDCAERVHHVIDLRL